MDEGELAEGHRFVGSSAEGLLDSQAFPHGAEGRLEAASGGGLVALLAGGCLVAGLGGYFAERAGAPGWLILACQGPKSVRTIRPSLS